VGYRERVIRLTLAVVLASAVAATPQLQRPSRPGPPQVGSGAITGVVVDGSSSAPIAGAVVYASIGGSDMAGAQSRQLTDSQGRFAFLDLPASDRLSVSASKPGYLDGGHSAANLPGTTSQLIALDDGEWVSGIRVELWKPGVIAGRVRDLPAGRYLIGALTDFEPEDLEDPAFLQQLAAQAVPVVIRDGERTVQSLRIAR
jgi:hypothetical protein